VQAGTDAVKAGHGDILDDKVGAFPVKYVFQGVAGALGADYLVIIVVEVLLKQVQQCRIIADSQDFSFRYHVIGISHFIWHKT